METGAFKFLPPPDAMAFDAVAKGGNNLLQTDLAEEAKMNVDTQ